MARRLCLGWIVISVLAGAALGYGLTYATPCADKGRHQQLSGLWRQALQMPSSRARTAHLREAFRQFDSATLHDFLLARAREGADNEMWLALESLAPLATSNDLEHLRHLMKNPDPERRLAFLYSVLLLNLSEKANDLLGSALADGDEGVRMLALRTLLQRGALLQDNGRGYIDIPSGFHRNPRWQEWVDAMLPCRLEWDPNLFTILVHDASPPPSP